MTVTPSRLDGSAERNAQAWSLTVRARWLTFCGMVLILAGAIMAEDDFFQGGVSVGPAFWCLVGGLAALAVAPWIRAAARAKATPATLEATIASWRQKNALEPTVLGPVPFAGLKIAFAAGVDTDQRRNGIAILASQADVTDMADATRNAGAVKWASHDDATSTTRLYAENLDVPDDDGLIEVDLSEFPLLRPWRMRTEDEVAAQKLLTPGLVAGLNSIGDTDVLFEWRDGLQIRWALGDVDAARWATFVAIDSTFRRGSETVWGPHARAGKRGDVLWDSAMETAARGALQQTSEVRERWSSLKLLAW